MEENITPAKPRRGFWIKIIPIVIIIALIAAMIGFKGYIIVEPGHRGVIVQLGKVMPYVLDEGFHIIVPFIQDVIPVEVRLQKDQSDQTTSSKDLQVVNTTIAVNYRLNPGNVNKLFQDVGLEYKEKVIDPAVSESLKAVTAQYTAEELISKRSEVSAKVKETLGKKLAVYYMELDDINITEFDFSDQFNQAIEEKQIAEQQALKANLDLQRIQVEAQQQIEQAKAEAEALKLQKDVITPELVELRKIEAQLEAIKKWDGKLPTVTGSGAVPFIDISNLNK
ncbi:MULTISPECIES: prohibitin family protein [Dehalobacter]|jgi:regulator of protease activity HflC (stomatin/prohibitin superfamily)|uniref:Prohibitin family protein n=2 Tax=Dehalobacter restrictus TaxID=55583 RepID=A0A857DJN1_9FIRM|nr:MULTISPECIES: prohibitin family protein [Dehalobacter]AHF10066.1 prohibitin family protein [Dehalobacter restrictus DSM 9455]MCG1025280.1 prohibitin family protein [Dehalobacter sp.]MDJ0306192.1 prohibitin family protein [Dehalobacter sp.]OCZ51971.1 HflC protein [Dehalobacter sp. TeCB1]QHA00669.1 prohibitin family protein [Dehalobacter restrictus]